VNPYLLDDDSCFLANGTFHFPSTTKEECLHSMYCWTPESIVTGLLLPPDSSSGECPKNGNLQSLFQWEEVQWIEGTWAFTKWTKRDAVQANVVKKTINFLQLQSNVSLPSDLSVKTFLQNQVSFLFKIIILLIF